MLCQGAATGVGDRSLDQLGMTNVALVLCWDALRNMSRNRFPLVYV